MKRITRDGRCICFCARHISIYNKAKARGWKTLWVGEGMICMKKA